MDLPETPAVKAEGYADLLTRKDAVVLSIHPAVGRSTRVKTGAVNRANFHSVFEHTRDYTDRRTVTA